MRAIAETVASQQVLLVLDTCEHVVTSVAQLASAVASLAARAHGTGHGRDREAGIVEVRREVSA